MLSTLRVSGFLSLILMSSLSYAHQQKPLRNAADILTVVDEKGAPVANANILLGYEVDKPFPGNTVTTDAKGTASIPADWKAELPLTVQADGYVITTIPSATPGMMTIGISHQEPNTEYEVKGTTTDYGTLVTDGKVDFGMVIPGISRMQMLAFDLSTVISPKVDTIDVIGNSVDIPSNIALPEQTETYVFPIDFNKPEYRVYPREMGQYEMFAARGQFPLQRVVNDIRAGKSMFELINYFNFAGGGQKTVDVSGNVTGADIAVNALKFDKTVSVTAPDYAKGNVMVSVALREQKGVLMPTDLKRLTPKQNMNLKSMGDTPSVMSVLLVDSAAMAKSTPMRAFDPLNIIEEYFASNGARIKAAQDFSKLSFALLPAAGGVAPQFIPLTAPPTITGQVVKMDMPKLPAGLTAVATYMVLSEIQVFETGKLKTERRTRLWEVWSNAWLDQVELPKVDIKRNGDRKYRWEVMFLARPTGFVSERSKTNVIDLTTITHVTRNALEI